MLVVYVDNYIFFCLGCRETAFVYAITSAGLTYEMIRACSKGKVRGCYNRCFTPENINPKLTRLMNSTHSKNEACDDNIRFGLKVWRQFVLNGEKASDIRARFNIRNNQVGLQVTKFSFKPVNSTYWSGNLSTQTLLVKK